LRDTSNTGSWAEDLALSHLRARGLQMLTRNFRRRFGEIDLIMSDGPTLVFVEVRYRASSRFGDPVDSVTSRKQQRIRRTAEAWLGANCGAEHRPCRFDVVSVTGESGKTAITWIRDAF
jgi:putative endonuclease